MADRLVTGIGIIRGIHPSSLPVQNWWLVLVLKTPLCLGFRRNMIAPFERLILRECSLSSQSMIFLRKSEQWKIITRDRFRKRKRPNRPLQRRRLLRRWLILPPRHTGPCHWPSSRPRTDEYKPGHLHIHGRRSLPPQRGDQAIEISSNPQRD